MCSAPSTWPLRNFPNRKTNQPMRRRQPLPSHRHSSAYQQNTHPLYRHRQSRQSKMRRTRVLDNMIGPNKKKIQPETPRHFVPRWRHSRTSFPTRVATRYPGTICTELVLPCRVLGGCLAFVVDPIIDSECGEGNMGDALRPLGQQARRVFSSFQPNSFRGKHTGETTWHLPLLRLAMSSP